MSTDRGFTSDNSWHWSKVSLAVRRRTANNYCTILFIVLDRINNKVSCWDYGFFLGLFVSLIAVSSHLGKHLTLIVVHIPFLSEWRIHHASPNIDSRSIDWSLGSHHEEASDRSLTLNLDTIVLCIDNKIPTFSTFGNTFKFHHLWNHVVVELFLSVIIFCNSYTPVGNCFHIPKWRLDLIVLYKLLDLLYWCLSLLSSLFIRWLIAIIISNSEISLILLNQVKSFIQKVLLSQPRIHQTSSPTSHILGITSRSNSTSLLKHNRHLSSPICLLDIVSKPTETPYKCLTSKSALKEWYWCLGIQCHSHEVRAVLNLL